MHATNMETEAQRGEGDPSCSQGWLQQNQLDLGSPGSMPIVSPLHCTNAIILQLLYFNNLQEQHAKKKKKAQSMAEILASLKWLHSAAVQDTAKAVFLYSIRQSTGGRSSEEILWGSIC